MSEVELKVPATGWCLVSNPCPECLVLVERLSRVFTYPGNQADCYACGNRLTNVRTEKVASNYDRYSGFGGYGDSASEYRITEMAFLRSLYTERDMQDWMTKHGLEGFETVGAAGTDWTVFSKQDDPDACVFVLLEQGVIGRCVLDVTQA